MRQTRFTFYNGIFPCFFHGLLSFLEANTDKSWQIRRRVILGSIISSTNPARTKNSARLRYQQKCANIYILWNLEQQQGKDFQTCGYTPARTAPHWICLYTRWKRLPWLPSQQFQQLAVQQKGKNEIITSNYDLSCFILPRRSSCLHGDVSSSWRRRLHHMPTS